MWRGRTGTAALRGGLRSAVGRRRGLGGRWGACRARQVVGRDATVRIAGLRTARSVVENKVIFFSRPFFPQLEPILSAGDIGCLLALSAELELSRVGKIEGQVARGSAAHPTSEG